MRYIVYLIMVYVASFLQMSVLPQITLFGVEADLLTALIIALSYRDGLPVGLFAALISGLCLDGIFSRVIGLYTFPLLAASLFSGIFFYTRINRFIFTCPILTFIGSLIKEFTSYFLIALLGHTVFPLYTIYRYVLPGALLCAVLSCFLCLSLHFLDKFQFMRVPSLSGKNDLILLKKKGRLYGKRE